MATRARKSKYSYRKRLTVSLLLLLLAVALLGGATWAWYYINRRDAGTMSVVTALTKSARVEYTTLLDGNNTVWRELNGNDPAALDMALAHPGESADFYVRVTNTGTVPVSVEEIGFLEPDAADERGRVIDASTYYLGSELYVRLTDIATSGAFSYTYATPMDVTDAATLGSQLRGNAPAALVLYDAAAATPGSFEIAVGGTATFTFRVTFVNRAVSQDEYKSFGVRDPSSEYCKRRLYVRY